MNRWVFGFAHPKSKGKEFKEGMASPLDYPMSSPDEYPLLSSTKYIIRGAALPGLSQVGGVGSCGVGR